MSLDVKLVDENGDSLYEDNITHNLGQMADRAGIYKCLWRPDENGFEFAEQIIEPLQKGLCSMVSHPAQYEKLNPPNGWGTYEGLVLWCIAYLKACQEYPKARIEVCR